ncbi:MAG: hypothetical protein HZA89_11865, partial [Verrucomicrobia bacterium]|nr:hypothetical protein [Verrucomicrobiota bacterium]
MTTSTSTRHQVVPPTAAVSAPRAFAPQLALALCALLWSIAPALHAQITNNAPRLDAIVSGGQVNAVVEMNNIIYFGGAFTEVGTNIGRAIMTDTNGAPYYTAGSGFPNNVLKFDGQVLSIVPDGSGGWYVGGSFFNVSGTPRLRLARIKSDYTLDPDFVANTDNNILAMELVGTNLYVGGDFTRITNVNSSGINTATNSRLRFAVLNPTNGSPRSFGGANGEPSFDSGVNAIAVGRADNNLNNIYVGGGFIRITNSLWTDGVVGSGAPGGNYSNIATNDKLRMAALDLTTGLPTSFQADLDQATTRAIVSHTNGAVYIGGDFVMVTNAGITYSNWRLAKLDGLTGASLTNTSAGGLRADLSGRVRAMIADGDTIFVGGDFTTTTNGAINSDLVNRITNLNNRILAINTNGVISTTWTPQVNGLVLGMYLDTNDVTTGNNLYIGGQFTSVTNFVGGSTTVRLRGAILSRDTSVAATYGTFNPRAGSDIFAIAPGNQTNVFFGGNVYFINAQTRNRLAAMDVTTGGLTTWNPNANNTVFAMAKHQYEGFNRIYVGGAFTTINGVTRNRIVSLNTDGTTDTTFINGAGQNQVRALAVTETNLFVGGDFTTWFNNSTTANAVARLGLVSVNLTNGLTNNPFTANFIKGSGTGATTNVAALAYDATSLYVAGGFTNINATPNVFGLVKLDRNTGSRDAAWQMHTGETNAAPIALAVVRTNIYVGGQFIRTTNTVGGTVSNRARLMALKPGDGTHSVNFTAVANNNVNAMAVFTNSAGQTNIILGGQFTTINLNTPNLAVARNRLVEISPLDGRVVTNSGFSWNPDMNNIVNAVAGSPDRVVAGGQFVSASSASVPRSASIAQLAMFERTNAAPTLTGQGGTTAYQNPGDPTTMDDTIVIRDANHLSFNGAAVSVSGNFSAGEDFLSAPSINGVTNSYDSGTGVLTISGGDNVGIATLQTILRGVQFYTGPDPTSLATRTISFVVQDKDGANSAAITRDVTVSKLNAPPTLNTPTNVVTVVGAAGRVVTLEGISDGGNGSQT